jgi:2-amino-4-hydroxy-6-hydroxymethyldihydropteridine diphosphokinase
MTRALLGLGSNLGDRRQYLRDAVAELPSVVDVSDVYETKPVGGPEQGPYLNLVVELDTELAPRELLDLCHHLERQAGRIRRVRWGPRTLDVDILWIDGCTVDEPDLVIPHPRMRERPFVMVPLADVAPDVADGWEGDEVDGVIPAGEL